MKTKNNKSENDGLYSFDGNVSIKKAIPFGLQHVLSMFVGNIVPIILVCGICDLTQEEIAKLIQVAMIMAGIGTLIQLFPIFKIGSRMPMVLGVSFTFVSTLSYVGLNYGYSYVLGAIMVGGACEYLLGLTCKYWRKLISPVVSGCVVIAIGVSLFNVGATSFGGGSNAADFGSITYWIVGGTTLIVCLLINSFGKGLIKNLSILFGMIAGYILAACFNIVDFSSVLSGGIISLPEVLPYMPKFNLSSCIAVALIFLVSATEAIGDTSALAECGFNREATEKEIGGGLMCDGFISSLSALFGCLPLTSFAQNVGLVGTTKVVNRKAIATGAFALIIAGVFPVIGNLLATIPDCVLGGCTIMLFGSIVLTGIKMLAKAGFSERNVTITSISLSFGIGFAQVGGIFAAFPDSIKNIFEGNIVALVFVIAFIFNLILPKEKEEK